MSRRRLTRVQIALNSVSSIMVLTALSCSDGTQFSTPPAMTLTLQRIDEVHDFVVPIQNRSDKRLEIEFLAASCSCIYARFRKVMLEPATTTDVPFTVRMSEARSTSQAVTLLVAGTQHMIPIDIILESGLYLVPSRLAVQLRDQDTNIANAFHIYGSAAGFDLDSAIVRLDGASSEVPVSATLVKRQADASGPLDSLGTIKIHAPLEYLGSTVFAINVCSKDGLVACRGEVVLSRL